MDGEKQSCSIAESSKQTFNSNVISGLQDTLIKLESFKSPPTGFELEYFPQFTTNFILTPKSDLSSTNSQTIPVLSHSYSFRTAETLSQQVDAFQQLCGSKNIINEPEQRFLSFPNASNSYQEKIKNNPHSIEYILKR